MALNNDIYFNAAYSGFLKGAVAGRKITSTTSADYLKLTQAAQAFATELDSLIPNDGLVSDGAAAQLKITTNTLAADEQWRAGLLQDLCAATLSGSFTQDSTLDYSGLAKAVKAAWSEALLLLVTP